MDKLWTFGDSFTAGHGCKETDEYYIKYYKEGDKIWPEHLADELNLKLMNLGVNGSSNEKIIDSIILNYDKISINDIVIIEKSYPHRLDVPNMNIEGNEWVTISSNYDFDWYLKTLSKEQYETAINFCYYFTNNLKYKKRQNLRFNFLNKCLIKNGIKVFVWDLLEIKNKKLHQVKYESIGGVTNNEISDGHFSFNGHYEFYKWIYQQIQTKNEII